MNNRLAPMLALAVLTGMSVFTVDQRERAIVFQLGEIMEVIAEPGLHFKWPLIQNVRMFDGRILTLDTPDTERFITSEKKNLLVDSFVKWRIEDVKQYYVSVSGDESQAHNRLAQWVNSALREEFGKRTVYEVGSGERDKLMEAVREKVIEDAKALGVLIVDVRLKRVELPQEVSESVFRRMDAERKAVASELRSQGSSDAEKIRAEADREREVIVAEAYKQAQRVKGEGDRKASAIYAQAFNENPEFYAFYRSMEAYRAAYNSALDLRTDITVCDIELALKHPTASPMRLSDGSAPWPNYRDNSWGALSTVTAPYAVSAGGGALVSSVVYVATAAVGSGASGTFFRYGVHAVVKTSAEAWVVGDKIFTGTTAKKDSAMYCETQIITHTVCVP